MEKEYWLRSEHTGWFKATQKNYQLVERSCGFSAVPGQDATASFSGTSAKSGLKWRGQTWNPYDD